MVKLMTVLQPDSPQALAATLAEAQAAQRPIRLGGAFTKDRFGGPLVATDNLISTARLSRVLEFEPRDLTISVEAGLPYRDLQALLARHHLMVPLDPPFADTATIGGTIATNLAGPRRHAFGTARDLLIGMTFATMEGKLVQSGGMVVKNVAGLDMAKVMVGSCGTLAAIASVNFKLISAPERTATFVLPFATLADAMKARRALLDGVLQPLAFDIVNPVAAARFGHPGRALLLLQAGGNEHVVLRFRKELPQAEVVAGDAEQALWQGVREFPAQFLETDPEGIVVRVGAPPSEIGAVLDSCPGMALARGGVGVAYACFPTTDLAASWLARTAERGWKPVVEFAPDAARRSMTLWPVTGSDFAIMESIKRMLDPDRLLNAGRLYGRL